MITCPYYYQKKLHPAVCLSAHSACRKQRVSRGESSLRSAQRAQPPVCECRGWRPAFGYRSQPWPRQGCVHPRVGLGLSFLDNSVARRGSLPHDSGLLVASLLQHGFTLFWMFWSLSLASLALQRLSSIKALRSSIIFTIAGNPNFQRIKKTMTKTSVIQKAIHRQGLINPYLLVKVH